MTASLAPTRESLGCAAALSAPCSLRVPVLPKLTVLAYPSHDHRWVLRGYAALPLNGGSVTASIGRRSGQTSPSNRESTPSSVTIQYDGAPAPTLSATFASGDVINAGVFHITATYSSPVSGVTVADFGATSDPAGIAQLQVSPTPDATATEWVLTVTMNPNVAFSQVTVRMLDGLANIVPAPGPVTNGPYVVK